jgi:hypothetical protein
MVGRAPDGSLRVPPSCEAPSFVEVSSRATKRRSSAGEAAKEAGDQVASATARPLFLELPPVVTARARNAIVIR